MAIKSIRIKNFKGIKLCVESFNFEPKYIGGDNGAGKTSFLEAIRYGLTGKTPAREDILTHGEKSGHVIITFDDPDETYISREFFAEKATKVSVNGQATTAKSAQQLICSLMMMNEENLDLCTSAEVFKELFKGELGKYLLSFIPEKFDANELFALCDFSEDEKEYIRVNLPDDFGLAECEMFYNELFTKRAALKANVKKLEASMSTIPAAPSRPYEDVEKDLANIIAGEQAKRSYEITTRNYETALAAFNKRKAEIASLEKEIADASDSVSEVKPEEKAAVKAQIDEISKTRTNALAAVKTLEANISLFSKTLENLNTPVCPISSKLICTTDKTEAKTEMTARINDNKAAIETQKKIISSCEAKIVALNKRYDDLLAMEKAFDRLNTKKSTLKRLKDSLGAEPVKPEAVSIPDLSAKPALTAEKEAHFKYNEYIKIKSVYEKVSKENDLISRLTVKFAPKGIVNEAIIGHYCEIFDDEIKDLAESIGFCINFVPEKGLTLSVRPNEDGKFVSFENLSTGEQLIVTMLVQHLCNTLSNSNILLVDNFNDLDEINAEKIKKLIYILSTEYSLIVVAGTNV